MASASLELHSRPPPAVTAGRGVYGGLFVLMLATVAYEILLTRIFSVTMWYHFAFVAVSVAMFGLTVGALAVYLRPGWFLPARTTDQLAGSALAFAITVIASLLVHLRWPVTFALTPWGVLTAGVFYLVVALPFALGGVATCLALTRFPRQVAGLYASDLMGAALGCFLVVPLLEVTDGPTAVVLVAALAAGASVGFASPGTRLRAAGVVTAGVLGVFAVGHTVLVHREAGLLRLAWVKGYAEARPLYEKWNSFSRITVFGDPTRDVEPRGWGLSTAMPPTRVRQLALLIDAGAGTFLTGFDGRPDTLEHLKYDITNLPHYLRADARVAVIGAGGGRDVLSALAFDQRSVIAIEINRDILRAVNGRFGAFTGHLDREPRVRFVNDEGRSFLARQREPFDLVQISLIDTWAATAAGAFVLTENSLYTVEAWRMFLDRLTPRGILAVSRYYIDERPDEIYRLTALAQAALRMRGTPDARPHVIVARQMPEPQPPGPLGRVGMATVMVAPSPFTAEDLDTVEAVSRRLGFDLVLTPRVAADQTFARLAEGRAGAAVLATFPANITPPTDDSPFFFQTLRFRDAFRAARTRLEVENVNMRAVSVLGALLAAVAGLTGLCVVGPLCLTARAVDLRGRTPLLVFFGAIGLGFMLVEISQMQRLIVVLGHPTYGLSVVLFALLVSSGVGSLAAGRVRGAGRGAVLLLPCVLAAFGVVTPAILRALEGASTGVRVAVATAMLVPIGLVMGLAFPLGMRLAARAAPALTPWLWGINGATSVLASVLAVAIALAAGISASFWTGVASYGLAAAAFLAASRTAGSTPERAHS